MKNKPSQIGVDFADEHLGHEGTIVMNVRDARYRYYQWLREWYGLGKKEATNKCPFYQFMFWGSMLMLASIVPIIIMKIIDIFVLWPLSWIAPDFVDDFNDTASKSKMVFSWIITAILTLIAAIMSAFLSSPILAWFGLIIHWLFAIPWLIAVATWLGVVFLVTEGIPWLFYGIGFVLEAIFAAIIAFINIHWLGVLLWIMMGLAVIVVFSVVFVLIYKLAVWFFKSSFTAWVIKKSCDVREFRIVKRKEHKVKVHKRKEENKRMKELKRQESETWAGGWKEPNEKWNEILMAAFSLIWAGLKIFPGYPLKLLGYGFRWIWRGIVLVEKGLEWIAKKIWDVIVVVWSLISETVSNHCPPIDFVVEISEKGELNRRSDARYRFTSENLGTDIIINTADLPDDFKPQKVGDKSQATIRCTVRKLDLDRSYGGIDVFKIQDLKYVPVRTTRKKK